MPIRILVADDHAVFRNGLTALLAKESDLEIVGEAATAGDTIRAAMETEADVLVLDIGMPGQSGVAAAAAISKRRPKLAIVILTMHEDEDYLQEMLKIGVRGYVLKKSSGEDLLQAIRTAYRGARYIDRGFADTLVSASVAGQPTGSPDRLGQLTRREREVCEMLAYGHTNAEIAENLHISERTVETHRSNIMNKIDAKTRAEVVRFAIDHGLMKHKR
ncbi:MAG: response regulator transcription factor [Planctomycetes bacterium]|nr:response regulator transcription factor [Planctomycetota bacterium]